MINADAFFEDAIVECRKNLSYWFYLHTEQIPHYFLSSYPVFNYTILYIDKFTLDLSGKVERIQTSGGIILSFADHLFSYSKYDI